MFGGMVSVNLTKEFVVIGDLCLRLWDISVCGVSFKVTCS